MNVFLEELSYPAEMPIQQGPWWLWTAGLGTVVPNCWQLPLPYPGTWHFDTVALALPRHC